MSVIKNHCSFLSLLISFFIFISIPYRVLGDTLKTTGDVLQIAIPVYALIYTTVKEDKKGLKEFFKGYSATMITTYTLKAVVHEKRPHTDSYNSFPSGHTASAFSGATYLYKRYHSTTFEKFQGVIAFILAGITGYSRISSKAHYPHDVIAGAVIAISITSFFTSSFKEKGVSIKITPDLSFIGLEIIY